MTNVAKYDPDRSKLTFWEWTTKMRPGVGISLAIVLPLLIMGVVGVCVASPGLTGAGFAVGGFFVIMALIFTGLSWEDFGAGRRPEQMRTEIIIGRATKRRPYRVLAEPCGDRVLVHTWRDGRHYVREFDASLEADEALQFATDEKARLAAHFTDKISPRAADPAAKSLAKVINK